MGSSHRDLALLDDPVARQLLTSTNPARLAYTWSDGTPRVVPIWFHWDGEAIVLGTPVKAPKLKVLVSRPAVSITIDTADFPYRVLSIRGRAEVECLTTFRQSTPQQRNATSVNRKGRPGFHSGGDSRWDVSGLSRSG